MEEEKKVYIGNLEFSVTEEDLRKFFEENGVTVKEVKIISDKFSGRSKGFGFGEFDTEEEAKEHGNYLQLLDSDFDVFVGAQFKWIHWNPDPNDKTKVKDSVYYEKELQDLEKGEKENKKQVKMQEHEKKNNEFKPARGSGMDRKAKQYSRMQKKLKRQTMKKEMETMKQALETGDDTNLSGENTETTHKDTKQLEKTVKSDKEQLNKQQKSLNNTTKQLETKKVELKDIDTKLSEMQKLFEKLDAKKKAKQTSN